MHMAIDEDGLTDLVQLFYARVRADEVIGPLFNEAVADWPEHLDRLQSFWSSVMLTSGRYKGRPLPVHMRHASRIDAASFKRWLELWEETTVELFESDLAAALQAKAERIAESLQLGIRFAADAALATRKAA